MPRLKKLIERTCREGPGLGLVVWCEVEAGPYQAIPQPGQSWAPLGRSVKYPLAYVRGGTAKLLTLFHPATGRVNVRAVTRIPNTVLHPWLKTELAAVIAALPPVNEAVRTQDPAQRRAAWERWQEGLSVRFTLLQDLPPLRVLLILDNLTGHKTPKLVCWLMAYGILPLYTSVGGSWLNMAKSMQRILVRRALSGQQPGNPGSDHDVVVEAVAQGWNVAPLYLGWQIRPASLTPTSSFIRRFGCWHSPTLRTSKTTSL
jgi:hypothetical protein